VITLFSIPKPFTGAAAVAQRNALRSWTALGPDLRVLLLGDEEGVVAAARDFGAQPVPGIECTELGTPLVSAAFAAAEELATTPVLLYSNADIVFLPDLLDAVRLVRRRRFLLVGRRRDARVDRELEPAEAAAVAERAPLFTEWGIDWFAFPRGVDWQMPPFAVGRPGWDNWLIWRARDLGMPVIDATRVVAALHQEHDYAHVPGGTGRTWEGPEAERNLAFLEGRRRRYSILDSTHVLTARGLVPALSPPYLKRRVRRLLS
jgi:hypothetical protein